MIPKMERDSQGSTFVLFSSLFIALFMLSSLFIALLCFLVHLLLYLCSSSSFIALFMFTMCL